MTRKSGFYPAMKLDEEAENRKAMQSRKEERKNHSIFVTGEAYRLQLEGPLFAGGLPTLSMGSTGGALLRHPPPILWSAVLKKGFVGCIRDVVINGKDIDVAKIAENQDSGE